MKSCFIVTIAAAFALRRRQSVLMGPGEFLELLFTGAPISEGDERSFVFVSEGTYMPMPYMNVAAGK